MRIVERLSRNAFTAEQGLAHTMVQPEQRNFLVSSKFAYCQSLTSINSIRVEPTQHI